MEKFVFLGIKEVRHEPTNHDPDRSRDGGSYVYTEYRYYYECGDQVCVVSTWETTSKFPFDQLDGQYCSQDELSRVTLEEDPEVGFMTRRPAGTLSVAEVSNKISWDDVPHELKVQSTSKKEVLTINAAPLIQHVLDAAEKEQAMAGLVQADYILCRQTVIWTSQLLRRNFQVNPKGHFHLMYPEQVLSLKAYQLMCEEIVKLRQQGYRFSITTSTAVPLGFLKWDEAYDIRGTEAVSVDISYGYGNILGANWHHQQ